MKKQSVFLLGLMVLFSIGVGFSQDLTGDKLVVPLSDPSKPATLEAGLVSGGITVEGYNGKEIIIEAKTRERKLDETAETKERLRLEVRERARELRREQSEEESKEKAEKIKGMQKLNVVSSGLSVEEDDNHVEVSTSSYLRAVDLYIQVPKKTSLKLNCLNNGDILVQNVEGELEVENLNGKITLKKVTGSVVAHALNRDITVDLEKVYPGKSMSFSSMNGDIDVTLPQNTKATLLLKNNYGDIYSDFDMSKHEIENKITKEDERTEDGKYKIEIENAMQLLLNGGGPEIQFTNFNGDIFIRKRK